VFSARILNQAAIIAVGHNPGVGDMTYHRAKSLLDTLESITAFPGPECVSRKASNRTHTSATQNLYTLVQLGQIELTLQQCPFQDYLTASGQENDNR
jgi:hypothetical protein